MEFYYINLFLNFLRSDFTKPSISFPRKRNTAIPAIQIAVLNVGCIVNVEVAQWLELGGLFGVFLSKPYLIRAENLLIQHP